MLTEITVHVVIHVSPLWHIIFDLNAASYMETSTTVWVYHKIWKHDKSL